MASDNMMVAALGRPFTLGMLYDARKDELIPGITLWDDDTVEANIQESSQQTSDFKVSASDSIDKKSSLLAVDASLKVSFLGGLIEVGGSAKYLNDHKKFKNQSRVTLQYKATTVFKQLSITGRGLKNMKQKDVIKKSLATHVVTGILYGVNAFFVFDSEKLEASSVQDIHGTMKAVIQKIPASVKARIQLTDKEEVLTKKFTCTFYGDFLLESNPATFEEAVQTYVQLPKLLRQKRESAVPVKVWLMPLKTFDPDAAQLMREISVGLVDKVQEVLENVRKFEMRCNDCLEDKVIKKFPQIHLKLRRFQVLCSHYTAALQRTLAKKLPSVRAGREPESSLRKHFEDTERSPFSHERLSKWMDHKEREINVIRFCVGIMDKTKTKIVSNKNELDREVLSQGVDDALCFVFTSMDGDDPCLDAMANYLGSAKSGSTSEDPWYFSDKVLSEMRGKAKVFHDLAKALKNNSRFCFLVAAITNKKYKGAAIYHYKDGILVTDNFTKPDVTNVKAVKNRRDLIWYACDLTLDPNTAHSYLTLSQGNKRATCGAWQTYPDHPDRFDTHLQVLCREELTGRHYWEVEWSNGYSDEVGVAVTYKRIGRKGGGTSSRLGHNAVSWYFGHRYGLYAWHNAKEHCGPLHYEDCRRVGVYLDWHAGTLSFYRVSSNRLSHLYTFNTRFTEPVYPAIWVWQTSSSVVLCPFE
ncbi:stonustoxin subunit beta-like [Toxotes jaculatrix]|uniref:stonustoxin subunit beta-like n=1 Tax=Toxotes jaculatrix TaxID=941984 RepID=UPI001B3B1B0A|nr:stonustoxin subunit beta-like [Toxotes jaculatrix]